MKSKIKLFFVSALFGVSAMSVTFAADDDTIAVAPTLPTEAKPAGKKRDGKDGAGPLEQRIQQLDERLQLTAAQKEQIKEIYAKEAAGLKAAKGTDTKDRRAAMMKIRDEVRAVLTPEQRTKFENMKGDGTKAEGRPGKAGAKKAR